MSSISASHLQAPNSRSLDPTPVFLFAVIKHSDQKRVGEGGPYLTCSLLLREARAGTQAGTWKWGPWGRMLLAGSLAHWLMPSRLSYSAQDYPPRDGAALSGLCLPASISDQTLLPTRVPRSFRSR